ncbi:MAG: hypothetical protein ACKPER_19510 [Dolichospermum sp.]
MRYKVTPPPTPSPLFERGLNMYLIRAETPVFLQKSNKVYVLLIEMKSTNPKGYLKQLKAAKSFVDFVLQRIKIFNDQINTEVEFRGLLFLVGRRTPNEGTTETKQKLKFEERNGLLISENPGNNTYHVQQFLEKID